MAEEQQENKPVVESTTVVEETISTPTETVSTTTTTVETTTEDGKETVTETETTETEDSEKKDDETTTVVSTTEGDEKDENIVPANAAQGGRETSDKVLYVGNLDKSITEDVLKQYFQVAGQIADVKVMVDKKNAHVNYAFVEYLTHHDANVALQTLNGIQLESKKVKINWAFQSQQNTSDENNFNLFIGDLSVDVDDETLRASFKEFPSFVQGHVMWDMQTGRSRGYGFASFSDQEQAQKAMDALQGKEINGRPIRINWATKRENNNQHSHNNNNNNRRGGNGFRNNNRSHSNNGNNNNNGMMHPMQVEGNMMPPMQQQQPPQQPPQQQQQMVPPPVNPQAIDDMIRRAPQRVTTAYIGNIPHFATEADLIPLLQNFGFILDFSYYPEKGCCFIKYDTHEQAAVCIVALANFQFQGRNLRTGWGKERNTFMPQPPQGPPQPGMMAPVMMGNAPMGDPQQQMPPQEQQEPQQQ
ncbi:similar to Saccharomyces cerevisiae YNL016W PUB1 Poly (A)+ RNA-binding protein, abundant mRNP-component protein that binds mRNA and is required for stability of many mRNAs [Maudiozyma saulgeensis]|uniref:Similar to Saccharomyces cerevisiae YNL016W PUB1 Poly (A)+ RNA-binding protein, abundant mRNP-component protein that binds mRNA and is required for stability of many mRNAs n=1 Tax=Maudiozyma saulgeensis TaxID=1789683 RepID=A0A1X7QZC9_9SACH|nr:similar to Saccharomyces cerevisiae YNL016W PUB1 Poly (A)+ RNA-binding protein, abundant mRNP-component protein that binds mRNA and is required for stability of many mRNAs [Kazachstania saulgeensis]